ncbi:MAG: Rab family GTPase [Candidatus Hodarchaeota archaeon]
MTGKKKSQAKVPEASYYSKMGQDSDPEELVGGELLSKLNSDVLYKLLIVLEVSGRSKLNKKKDRIKQLEGMVTWNVLNKLGLKTTADIETTTRKTSSPRIVRGKKKQERLMKTSKDFPRKKSLELMFESFSSVVPYAKAIVVIELANNKPIVTLTRSGSDGDVGDSGITASINQVFEHLESKALAGLGSVSYFDTELNRLIFIKYEKMMFCFMLELDAYVDKALPYAYISAEKIKNILNGELVELNVPVISESLDLDKDGDKEKIFNLLSEENEFRTKIIVVGDEAVGKTTLIYQYSENKFKDSFLPTLGVNVTNQPIQIVNTLVSATIWDMGGQKQFRRARANYYIGAKAGFIVFDLTRRSSFENVKTWDADIKRFGGEISIVLLGNKSDLGNREVSFEEASQLAREMKYSYLETSAKTGINVREAFDLVAFKFLDDT